MPKTGEVTRQAVQPLQRSRLSSQIADIIRADVLSGELGPGEKVGQVQWAERVGASRMPVRDAIAQLCTEGILVQSGSGSATVSEVRLEDIADAWEVNATIVSMATRRAAERIDADGLAELAAIEEAMEAEIERGGDLTEAGRRNWEFHVAINRAARSTQLLALLRSLNRTLSPANFRLMEDWAERAPREHRAILKALRSGDGERAMKLMRRHVEVGYQPTLERLGSDTAARPADTVRPS